VGVHASGDDSGVVDDADDGGRVTGGIGCSITRVADMSCDRSRITAGDTNSNVRVLVIAAAGNCNRIASSEQIDAHSVPATGAEVPVPLRKSIRASTGAMVADADDTSGTDFTSPSLLPEVVTNVYAPIASPVRYNASALNSRTGSPRFRPMQCKVRN
jgi:hypothetical protein